MVINNVEKYSEKVFEEIKHIDEEGNEYWEARELMKVLEYSKWENFNKVIQKGINACQNSNNNSNEHFPDIRKTLEMPNNALKEIVDYHLSRYACYLIAMNADSRKKVIALAQTYFAIQTRKMEILESEYEKLSEDDKRLYQRELTRKGNYSLNQAASIAGVRNFGEFHNAGYRGLYNGETADDIFKRKGLDYRQDILDYMGEDELIVNMFRINQTKQKLKNDKVKGETNANNAHYKVGKEVRNTIKKLGGTMPEDMPTPKRSIKEINKSKLLK